MFHVGKTEYISTAHREIGFGLHVRRSGVDNVPRNEAITKKYTHRVNSNSVIYLLASIFSLNSIN